MKSLYSRVLSSVALTAMLSACTSVPSDKLSGNDLSHLSLRDKRMAEKQVRVLDVPPAQAELIGVAESERCQSGALSEEPDQKTLLVDIKAEAYRLGANAISNIQYHTQGAVAEGCWNVFKVTANMFVVK